ncbi:hypothetical protein HispidOSU_030028 [Sigmodon hispidus]
MATSFLGHASPNQQVYAGLGSRQAQGMLFATSRRQTLLARTFLASRARARCRGTGSDCACKFPRSLQGKLRPASPGDAVRAVSQVGRPKSAAYNSVAKRPRVWKYQADEGGMWPPMALWARRRCAQWEPLPSRFRADSPRGLATLGGPRGRDPSFHRGLRGAPEGGQLPSNGAVARRVPGLGERELGLQEAALGRAPGKKPRSPLRGPRLLFLAGSGAQRLPLTPSLCGVPAAIVSGRGMEDLAVPQCHVQGLWGIQRQLAVFVGGLQNTASRKGPGVGFPKSDRPCSKP